MSTSVRIAIFASGSGTNAEEILKYFNNHLDVEIACVLSNNPNAFVIERAKKWKKPYMIFSRNQLYQTDDVVQYLDEKKINMIVLAGFLWLAPSKLLDRFGPVLNIHPALLPKYGGKGMYGSKIHQKVVENGERQSGITIHYVNDKYDEGEIIFQTAFDIDKEDTVEDVEKKIHALEYDHYPRVIEKIAAKI